MSKVYDIDAGAVEPVRIRLRGKEWALGSNIFELLAALDAYRAVAAKEKDGAKVGMLMVDPVLRALVPGVGKILDEAPLGAREQLALIKPLTEALNQVGSFRAPA